MRRRNQRAIFIGVGAGLLALAAALVLLALEDSIVFFYSPADLAEKPVAEGERLRLGGLVEAGSVARAEDGTVRFAVTDFTGSVIVSFNGILPDLFREGQGVVAEGAFGPGGSTGGTFVATEVLAKHDETYMPPEVAEALRESGQWYGEGPGGEAYDGPSHAETFGSGPSEQDAR